MLNIGETIIYGTNGACFIKNIETMNFGKESMEYYVLTPVFDENSKIYVPVGSEAANTKMRKILSKDEFDSIILSLKEEKTEWIDDDNERKKYGDSVIASGDRKEIMLLIGMIYMKKQELKAKKKHLYAIDEKLLNEGEKIIENELAYILGIEKEKVSSYIEEKING